MRLRTLPAAVAVCLALCAPSATAVGPAVDGLSFNPNPVVGGNQTTGTVHLSCTAGGTVTLSKSGDTNNVVHLPATVTVPAGSSSANFNVTTDAVTTQKCIIVYAQTPGTNAYQNTLCVNPALRAGVSFSTYASRGAPGETVELATLMYSGGKPVPDRPVCFSVGGQFVDCGTTDGNGKATVSYRIPGCPMSPGVHDITVSFTGDCAYHPGSRTARDLNIVPGRTGVSFSIYSVTGALGQMVQLAALMYSGGNPVVSEWLCFYVDGVYVDRGATDNVGKALVSYTIPASMAAGTHDVTVCYAGSSKYASGCRTSPALKVVVPKANVSFSLYAVSGAPGQPVTLKTLVYSGGVAAPGLPIQFAVDGVAVGSPVTSTASGAETPYTIPASLSTGPHNVTVTFAGDATHNPATRTTAALTVK